MTSAHLLLPAERAAMIRACELAASGAGTVLPNPVVGCVIVGPGGHTLGEGFHDHPGGPHAEVVALGQAGESAAGATAVVTLEPCNHTGRTGPCTEALLAAGIARVVVAVRDPFPAAAGGIERLRSAGINVVDLSAEAGSSMTGAAPDARPAAVGDPWSEVSDLVAAAEDVNRVFLTAVRTGRPFVTLKMATTLDGRVAAADGTSRWISSVEARRDAHRLRREIDGIAVGIGTVLADDPQLTARSDDGAPSGRQPLRVVIDSHGRTPAGARVRNEDAPTLIATTASFGSDEHGRVRLDAVLDELYAAGRRHLLVEGGPRLAAAFLDAGLVDEVLVYLAPLLLGNGRSALEGGSVRTLIDARRATLREMHPLGPDVRLRYRMDRPGEVTGR